MTGILTPWCAAAMGLLFALWGSFEPIIPSTFLDSQVGGVVSVAAGVAAGMALTGACWEAALPALILLLSQPHRLKIAATALPSSLALVCKDIWLLARYVSLQLPPAVNLVAETSHLRFISFLLFCAFLALTATTCFVYSWVLRQALLAYWRAPQMVCTHCMHDVRPAPMENISVNCIYHGYVTGRTRNRIKQVHAPTPNRYDPSKCTHDRRTLRFRPVLALAVGSIGCRVSILAQCTIVGVITTFACFVAAHVHNLGLVPSLWPVLTPILEICIHCVADSAWLFHACWQTFSVCMYSAAALAWSVVTSIFAIVTRIC